MTSAGLAKRVDAAVEGLSISGLLYPLGNKVFFTAFEEGTGTELWVADRNGISLVRDISPGEESSDPSNIRIINKTLYFDADDGTHGMELWRVDGQGASLVKDILPGPFSGVRGLRTGSTPYLAADNGTTGMELWRLNGNSVSLVADINRVPLVGSSATAGSFAQDIVQAGGTLFFVASDKNSSVIDIDFELWKSDGSSEGTTLVKDIRAGDGSNPVFLTAIGGKVYFRADDGISGPALWVSDGSSEGTTMVRDAATGAVLQRPFELMPFGDKLLFFCDAGFGVADGAGARILDVSASAFKPAGSRLFVSGDKIYTLDPATETATLFADVASSASSSHEMAVIGETVYFVGNDFGADAGAAVTGGELWRSDGTEEGTYLVGDIAPGADSSDPHFLTAAGSSLFFLAEDGDGEQRLWVVDGTSLAIAARQTSHPEGHRGRTTVEFTITRRGDLSQSTRADWRVSGSGDQPADAEDFGGRFPSGTVTFAPGERSRTIAVEVAGDRLGEADEHFTVTLSSAQAGLTTASAESTIRNDEIWLAMSGGGWNTHSLLAGLVAGALDALEERSGQTGDPLERLMGNVEGIGAISGGSWFLSHLAYSRSFANKISSRINRDLYNTKGYNGLLDGLINEAISSKTPRGSRFFRTAIRDLRNYLEKFNLSSVEIENALDRLELIVKVSAHFGSGRPNWRTFVEELVYGPFAMNRRLSGLGLDGPRQTWARDKDIVIATGLSTGEAVLHSNLSLSPSQLSPTTAQSSSTYLLLGAAEPTLAGAQGRPLGLRSLVAPDGTVESFADDPAGGGLSFAYRDSLLSRKKATRVTLNRGGRIPLAPGLSVIDATIASSSALALLAQPQAYGLIGQLLDVDEVLASALRSLAPLASFRNRSGIELDIPDSSPSADRLNDQLQASTSAAEVRLMDGGYLDNAPAAYLLRHIQEDQGVDRPFELTLFFNSSIDPLTGVRMPVAETGASLSSYRLPVDLAQLFGRTAGEALAPAGSLVDGPFPAFQNRMPSAQIFEENAWIGESQPEWSFEQDSVQIQYFDLDVRTVANRQFGIAAGQQGRLRLFVSNNRESFAAPHKPSHLREYRQNYSLARAAIEAFGGADPLLDALAIPAMAPL